MIFSLICLCFKSPKVLRFIVLVFSINELFKIIQKLFTHIGFNIAHCFLRFASVRFRHRLHSKLVKEFKYVQVCNDDMENEILRENLSKDCFAQVFLDAIKLRTILSVFNSKLPTETCSKVVRIF